MRRYTRHVPAEPSPSSVRPSAGRVRHSGDDVLAAAVALLDRYGLADLTMRRLAAELDVRPSALYWHFANKQTLLAAVSDWITRDRPERDALLARVAERLPGWTGRLRAEAVWLRLALLEHRDGAEVVASTIALGLGHDVPERHLTLAAAAAGVPDDVARAAAQAMLHLVLGSTQHEQQRAQARALGVAVGDPAPVAHALADGALTDVPEVADLPGDVAFGVDLLVDGLDARVAAAGADGAAGTRGTADAAEPGAGESRPARGEAAR